MIMGHWFLAGWCGWMLGIKRGECPANQELTRLEHHVTSQTAMTCENLCRSKEIKMTFGGILST